MQWELLVTANSIASLRVMHWAKLKLAALVCVTMVHKVKQLRKI
jgi:hypothetical protein